MFGGIVETVGRVQAESLLKGCKHLSISPQRSFADLRVGDSLAVNGVCLTLTQVHEKHFTCNVVPETLALTTMNQLEVGSFVNLERALKVSDRIGGHYVQGHIDGVGEINDIQAQGAAWLVTIRIEPILAKYVVKKGYVAVDGMSLTIVQVEQNQFSVTFIPHTQAVTIAKHYRIGSQLNVEVDILGKYVEKLLTRASL